MESEVRNALGEKQYILAQQLCDDWLKIAPCAAVAHYLAAWSRDAQGLEAEALPFYESAFALGLTGNDLRGALLGAASTCRSLGEFDRSEDLLRRGIKEFADSSEFRAFLAMILYASGRCKEAISTLLELLVDTTNDHYIKQYERALREFSGNPDAN
jgi:tetratricopeptide (TPR) repeat protein